VPHGALDKRKPYQQQLKQTEQTKTHTYMNRGLAERGPWDISSSYLCWNTRIPWLTVKQLGPRFICDQCKVNIFRMRMTMNGGLENRGSENRKERSWRTRMARKLKWKINVTLRLELHLCCKLREGLCPRLALQKIAFNIKNNKIRTESTGLFYMQVVFRKGMLDFILLTIQENKLIFYILIKVFSVLDFK